MVALVGGVLGWQVGAGHAEEGDAGIAAQGLLREIFEQQTTISEHQVEIEVRLAKVAEDVRVARLFAARSGGGRVKP
jgi:hypothetical protein